MVPADCRSSDDCPPPDPQGSSPYFCAISVRLRNLREADTVIVIYGSMAVPSCPSYSIHLKYGAFIRLTGTEWSATAPARCRRYMTS